MFHELHRMHMVQPCSTGTMHNENRCVSKPITIPFKLDPIGDVAVTKSKLWMTLNSVAKLYVGRKLVTLDWATGKLKAALKRNTVNVGCCQMVYGLAEIKAVVYAGTISQAEISN